MYVYIYIYIVIVNIERCYANRIFQESMDSIIDILGKRKIVNFSLLNTWTLYMWSVHVLIILLYCVKKVGSKALSLSNFSYLI